MEGVASVSREALKQNSELASKELDSMLAGMVSSFDNDLDGLMEQSLEELLPMPVGMDDQDMDTIFTETLTYMPEMETELKQFSDVTCGDEVKVDELYS